MTVCVLMLMMMMTRLVLVSWHFAVLVLRVGGSLPVWRVEKGYMLFFHEGMIAVVLGAFWKGMCSDVCWMRC